MFKNIGLGLEQLGLQADAIVEQQSSGCNCGAAVEADAIGEQQSVKQTQSGSSS